MSLRFVEVSCDWPECQQTARLEWYLGSFHDHEWSDQNGLKGQHLCPTHALYSWKEFTAECAKYFEQNWKKSLEGVSVPTRKTFPMLGV